MILTTNAHIINCWVMEEFSYEKLIVMYGNQFMLGFSFG
jgi:hypothetical protein